MKTYEKPKLIALSLNGNERLCGDCADGLTLYNNEAGIKDNLQRAGLGTYIGDKDGILERSDFTNLFDVGSCNTLLSSFPGFEAYCKFSGSGLNIIAWS